MKLIEIKPQVYYLVFDTKYELCSTMMRLEEFYESPYKNIRGKYFTLEQFMDTYAKHMGNFTYTSDWSGFNIPSDTIKRFLQVFCGSTDPQTCTDLLKKEQYLFGLLSMIKENKYYLIATYKEGIKRAFNHELAHAYYYLDKKYKEKMDALIKKFKYKKKFEGKLLKAGYCKAVLMDEMQAYLSTCEKEDINKKILSKKWKIPKKIVKTFKKKNKNG